VITYLSAQNQGQKYAKSGAKHAKSGAKYAKSGAKHAKSGAGLFYGVLING